MKTKIQLKTMGRGLYAYFPKKYFHAGQEITIEVDDLTANAENIGVDIDAIAFDIESKIMKRLEDYLVKKYLLDKSKKIVLKATSEYNDY